MGQDKKSSREDIIEDYSIGHKQDEAKQARPEAGTENKRHSTAEKPGKAGRLHKTSSHKTSHKNSHGHDISAMEMEQMLKRLQADFENYKKYVEKEKQQIVKTATRGLIKDLLPFIDSFENALRHYNTSHSSDANTRPEAAKFFDGLSSLFAQFMAIMESHGLKKISAVGKPFDPYFHEAMMQQETDKEDNIVLKELQPGYMLNDYVIRHSKVIIGKNTKQAGRSQQSQQNKGNSKTSDNAMPDEK